MKLFLGHYRELIAVSLIFQTQGRFHSAQPLIMKRRLDNGADNEYNLVVTATDNSSNTSDLSVTITVMDVNDTVDLIITGSESVSVEENQTTVSTYSANETVSWSLSGTDSSLFNISNTGGFHSAQPLIMKRHLMMNQTMNII